MTWSPSRRRRAIVLLLAVLAVVIMAVASIRSSTSDPSLAVGASPVGTTTVAYGASV